MAANAARKRTAQLLAEEVTQLRADVDELRQLVADAYGRGRDDEAAGADYPKPAKKAAPAAKKAAPAATK